MALPADFSKIFASTATGGITPPSDLNYAKGWEWIGANPPEKNDFNYLQNLSDLKAQWLYNYVTTTSNASSRTIGGGTNQVPDMSLFASLGASPGYQKLPSGIIIQWGESDSGSPSTVTTTTLPISFTTSFFQVVACYNQLGGTGAVVGAVPLSLSQFRMQSGNSTGQFARWFAIGK